jgi:hypothetical protein
MKEMKEEKETLKETTSRLSMHKTQFRPKQICIRVLYVLNEIGLTEQSTVSLVCFTSPLDLHHILFCNEEKERR